MAQRRPQHNAQPGDMIEFKRPGYQHWGVFVGDDKVVHVSPDDSNKRGSSKSVCPGSSIPAVVKSENIHAVAGSSQFLVNNGLDAKYKPRPAGDIVKEANKMVGKKVPYSLTGANCEHFASKMRYGKAESTQVPSNADVNREAMLWALQN